MDEADQMVGSLGGFGSVGLEVVSDFTGFAGGPKFSHSAQMWAEGPNWMPGLIIHFHKSFCVSFGRNQKPSPDLILPSKVWELPQKGQLSVRGIEGL